MSTQLFEEESPAAAPVKTPRTSRSAPAPKPEIALTDPFADEPEGAPAAESEPASSAVTLAPELPESVALMEATDEAPATRMPQKEEATSHPRSLPEERQSLTMTLRSGGCEGLVVIGLFDEGTPGEVLLLLRKAPPEAQAALEAYAAALTLALPYGVPAGALADQLLGLLAAGPSREAAQAIAQALRSRF